MRKNEKHEYQKRFHLFETINNYSEALFKAQIQNFIDIFSILDQKHDPGKSSFLSPKVDYNFLQHPNVNKCLFIYHICRCRNLSRWLLMPQGVFPSCLGHNITLREPQKLTEPSIVGERRGYTCRGACTTGRQSSES